MKEDKNRKRVLIIGHTYVTPINRSKFKFMAEDERFEFLIVVPKKWKGKATIHDNSVGVNIAYVDIWFSWHIATYIIPKLNKLIKDFKPHFIYCEQEPICLISFQAAILSKHIPITFFSWENIYRRDILYRLFSFNIYFCLRKSKFIVAGSKETAVVLRKRGYKRGIYITPLLGVNEDLFKPQKKKSYKNFFCNAHFKIGFVGRFVDVKDVKTLLQGVSLLDEQMDWHLYLIGDGPLEDEYKKLINGLEINEKVTFFGTIPHDKVPQYISELDVLVLPSKSIPKNKEQFGHVLIEAMACGIPVIGSSSGEIPNVIGEAGLIFKEGDPKELSEKLLLLYNNCSLRNQLKNSGKQRINKLYTDKRIAANMIALVEIGLNMRHLIQNTLTRI